MEQQFKVGDIVQVATMEKLPNDVRNWALDEELKLGIDYTVKSAENGWVVVHQYYHRESRFKLKTSNMELKTTKYKVLAAAAKCSTAKATLETLFPEAFEDEDLINSDSVTYKEYPYAKCLRLNDRVDLITAYAKQQGYKGLILNSSFNWELKKINGSLSLIPTRKPS